MISNPLLSIVIPTRDQWHLTAQCLHALRAATPGDFFEILLVDNGSSDDTPRVAPDLGQELFGERFVFLRQETNTGFGPACNLGARAARGDLLFLLNNDTVPKPGWFDPLRDALAAETDIGAVGPLLVYPNAGTSMETKVEPNAVPEIRSEFGRVQHLGIAFCLQKRGHHLYEYFPSRHPLVKKKRRVQALTGAALLLPRALFLDLGGFFPGYANGYEDLELCARIREQGLGLRCVPDSEIIHYSSQTPGRFDHDQANAGLLQKRCDVLLTPDLHRHLLHDGLELRLTPWLLPHAAMTDQDSQRVANQAPATASLNALLVLLRDHPLWVSGYKAATAIVEQRGNWVQALELRLRQVNLCPSLAAYQGLFRAALKSRHRHLMEEARSKLDMIRTMLSAPHGLHRKALHLLRLAAQTGDDHLKAAYQRQVSARSA